MLDQLLFFNSPAGSACDVMSNYLMLRYSVAFFLNGKLTGKAGRKVEETKETGSGPISHWINHSERGYSCS
jgi:hypothetical protein